MQSGNQFILRQVGINGIDGLGNSHRIHLAWGPGEIDTGHLDRRVTKSGRSEAILPAATPGISQKFLALCLKPCGPAEQHPHDPHAAMGKQSYPQF
ncbi:hypothetical protein Q5P01_018140 [Channa striata]|uniref:Uncharacterized protein n=1 Tax=Channa striata TaxID=64152 RepID=A0AA88M4F6_CHASR|nr:hypothetical protein Q5P01_018140 [Channa striata]